MDSKLFANMDSKTKEVFLQLCKKEPIKSGTIIKKEGAKTDKAFFLLEGTVNVKKSSSQGEMGVATIQGGEDVLFSFTCMLDGGKSLTSIEATSDCVLLSFTKKEFLQFCTQNPEAGNQMLVNALSMMAAFLRKSDEKIAQMYQTLEEVL